MPEATSHWLDLDDDEEVGAPRDSPPAPVDEPETPGPDDSAPDALEATDPEGEDAASPVETPAQDNTAPETPEAPATPPAAAPKGEPLVITASRKQYTIEGVEQRPDGLLIPATAMERVTQMMRRALDAETEVLPRMNRAERRVRELEAQVAQKSPREVESETLLTELDRLLDQGPEAVAAFLEDYDRQRPILRAKAMEAAATHRIQQIERAAQPDPEEYIADAERDAVQRVDTMVREIVTTAGLAAEDAQFLTDRYRQRLAAYVVRVPRDMPELGLRAGQLALKEQELVADLQYEAGMRADAKRRASEAAEQAKRETAAALKAKQRNAAVVAAAKPKPSAPNPAAPVAAKTGASFADWRQSLLDDDDE